ncbi:hypothetical protein Tco_0084343 [Tanacetum coccineum]
MANFPLLDELAVAANSRGCLMGCWCTLIGKMEKILTLKMVSTTYTAELLERTNERQLFITKLEGLCPSVITYKILKFLNEVQKHDLIQLLELRKMIVGTYRQVSRKIALIETIMSL